jgi:hypothetical protein
LKTQPENEGGNNNDVARQLAERLADMEAAKDKIEAANIALKEEIERKNRALEGFMAENEALKAELAGKKAPPAPGPVKDTNTGGAGSKSRNDFVALLRRVG